ncbi:hypothetical protein [Stenotrophomonas sp. S41]|uniref:hypothetical protein n=1 Tax=Stenotrophomonas sp. S41 TaxID=2767464 RepID=UPI00190C5E9B|nr:hypothetical protein [Stenotrophomonas sp. S41]MBK0012488.1 hypothetical protein [Stenotrophomonas sp. S41]
MAALAIPAICILVTVVGLYVARRNIARHPDGRHWLLLTLALVSPVSLLAAFLIGLVQSRLPHGLIPPQMFNALSVIALLLPLVGVCTAPLSWRVFVLRRLHRGSGSLPFFRAPRVQLLALFALAAAYMLVRGHTGPVGLPMPLQPNYLTLAAGIVMGLIHVVLTVVFLTLPVMALWALASGGVRAAWTRRRSAR